MSDIRNSFKMPSGFEVFFYKLEKHKRYYICKEKFKLKIY